MDIKLIAVGKTDKTELDQLIKSYQNRLMHYVRFSFEIIPVSYTHLTLPTNREV